MTNLTHHEWKLIFSAVRKQQLNSITDGKEYKELNSILDKIYDLAYTETYSDDKEAIRN